jgi:hypothetical protein
MSNNTGPRSLIPSSPQIFFEPFYHSAWNIEPARLFSPLNARKLFPWNRRPVDCVGPAAACCSSTQPFQETEVNSRPHKLLSRVPGVLAPTFMAGRPGIARRRNPAARRVVRWKTRHVPTPASLDGAIVPARTLRRRRWRVRAIATSVRHAGRVIAFDTAVVLIHLAVLRWVFLPIGA